MIKFGKLCKCGDEQKPKKINDKHKTVYCEVCWNIISWEDSSKEAKKIKKSVYHKGFSEEIESAYLDERIEEYNNNQSKKK